MSYDAGLAVTPDKTRSSFRQPLGLTGRRGRWARERRGGRVSGMAVIRVESLRLAVCCHGGASMSLRPTLAGDLAGMLARLAWRNQEDSRSKPGA